MKDDERPMGREEGTARLEEPGKTVKLVLTRRKLVSGTPELNRIYNLICLLAIERLF